MEEKMTREDFEIITQLKNKIEYCSSNKEAKVYIDELKTIRYRYSGRVAYKLGDLISSLTEYSKRGNNKESWENFVNQDYFILESFIDQ